MEGKRKETTEGRLCMGLIYLAITVNIMLINVENGKIDTFRTVT